MEMFKFLQRRHAKKNGHHTVDLYELNEQELETLMGGSPVRHLIGGEYNTPPRQLTTNMGFNSASTGFDNASYQPFQATYPQNTWQQAPSWVQQIGEETSTNRLSYYNK
jgi:hypothetical protein